MSKKSTAGLSAFYASMPETLLQHPIEFVVQTLEIAYGSELYAAFDPDVQIPGPNAFKKDTQWLKTANTVGINVRTIQNFWNIIPYSFSLPAAQNAIHILPLWEPGVVASLYGPSTWQVNPEFYNPELANAFSHLNTVEKQLKVVVNILHLMGRSVGMDVVPHTDRFSEMALANPRYFEWLLRRNDVIERHDSALAEWVENLLWEFLIENGSAQNDIDLPNNSLDFFTQYPENKRLKALFGAPEDYGLRLYRRKKMIRLLYTEGLETAPATMGPPYRGLEVDPSPEARTTDEDGLIWLDYRIQKPEPFSRVFGPLSRYKLWETHANSSEWALDFAKPNVPAWEYVCSHYLEIQKQYNFDFMRGDMSHVQMRPEGVPAQRDQYYDLLGAVKCEIQKHQPSFGYFAESFLAPPGVMAYGDECDHLEACFADSTLGDLQSETVGTAHFVKQFAQYTHWLQTRRFAPCFTLMTADKDDPRFDEYYLNGNELRYFIGLFLSDMPSYMGLGFECRDTHFMPAPNEHYTKLYVFQMKEGPKGTKKTYCWGKNEKLYQNLARQKHISDQIGSAIFDAKSHWLLPPDPTGNRKTIAWTQTENPLYIFCVNFDPQNPNALLNNWNLAGDWKCIFSSLHETIQHPPLWSASQPSTRVLQPEECLIFERM